MHWKTTITSFTKGKTVFREPKIYNILNTNTNVAEVKQAAHNPKNTLKALL